MDYLGRATSIKFSTKINGTHTLSFQMPDRFFDSLSGEYVRNEFIDRIFNECRVKLWYKNKWYDFYIKNISEQKYHKSFMKTFQCQDAFIDELARNGYGITFHTELYNNVEEIGTFTDIILEDSAWVYTPQYNWGDFTEYLEEKLFRIPIGSNGLFTKAIGYKLDYSINTSEVIKNYYNKKTRPVEMGDDLAAPRDQKTGYFWDDYNEQNPLLKESEEIETNGYIYIPYSELQFCYKTTTTENNQVLVATEEVCYYPKNGNNLSYAIAPSTVDPSALIKFIAFPANAEIEIDESGLIVNKEYTYVMTVEDWNKNIKSTCYYQFLPDNKDKKKYFFTNRDINQQLTPREAALGNKVGYYEGYLDKLGDIEVRNGKNISITDRTEINISDEINQYVKVYKNKSNEYADLFSNPDEKWVGDINNYRVCSKSETRQIVPQLAHNLVQNGSNFRSNSGWEPQSIYSGERAVCYGKLSIALQSDAKKEDDISITTNDPYLEITPAYWIKDATTQPYQQEGYLYDIYNTIVNFGIVGQEYEIKANTIYCLGLKAIGLNGKVPDITIRIGQGGVLTQGDYTINTDNGIVLPVQKILASNSEGYIFLKFKQTIKNPYIAITYNNVDENTVGYKLYKLQFFEAYTKGVDQFDGDLIYRYSGRDLFDSVLDGEILNGTQISLPLTFNTIHNMILFEDDIMSGDTYEYNKYFIQQAVAYETDYKTGIRTGNYAISDTFMAKELVSSTSEDIIFNHTNFSHYELPYSAAQFSDDDIELSTQYIDLNKCKYYVNNNLITDCDCSYQGQHICLYQKYGYCPYLFKTEKHCRKIRTLNGEKSNRFNLTQEIGKVFEVYPVYEIDHEENGHIQNKTDSRKIFYITEKGNENKIGFRYEKNLENISRTIKSDQIITKLYVEDIDSEISKTGLCSIKTAEDNPSKDNFIIDFSYYIAKGLLSREQTDADLYGKDNNDIGYLKKLGYLNTQYDQLSNIIINLTNESFVELQSNLETNITGISSAQQELMKVKKSMEKYKANITTQEEIEKNESYLAEIEKYNTHLTQLNNLIFETFFDQNTMQYIDINSSPNTIVIQTIQDPDNQIEVSTFFDNMTIDEFKESPWMTQHIYNQGMLGQFNREYLYISELKKQQAYYLKEINKLTLEFFRKYEPFLKEGTWSDSNYLTDNAYYFGAKEVAAEGAIPKVEYSINVIDISSLPGLEDYEFDIADTTYVEDIGMFGINKITGLPNKLKTLITSINEVLDLPENNSIDVQNFTTQFEDLFQQITASVQSLSFNENIYKRSSNFTSTQDIAKDSLQGTLDTNDLTLLDTSEQNIQLDQSGQSGSNINNHNEKYKLNGQGLFFSNNGGQTWNVGVGPGGINADYINTGSLDAGKIRIVDNNYLYFYWDKNGITALRDPKDTSGDITFQDYSLFNKYGLSLVEDGKIRLRAGYNFNGASTATSPELPKDDYGKMSTEKVQGSNIGFYLYNTEGDPIFKTETASENKALNTARLSLSGEMFITDSKLTDTESIISSQHSIYEIKKGYNLITKVVNEYNEYQSEDWRDRVTLNLGDILIISTETAEDNPYVIDGHNYMKRSYCYKLTSKENENIPYCLINSQLGSNYLHQLTLTFETYYEYFNDGEPDRTIVNLDNVEEYYYLNLDMSNCYSLSLNKYSIYIVSEYSEIESNYTIDKNSLFTIYNVYFPISGGLSPVSSLNLVEIQTGFDIQLQKIIDLNYSYWIEKNDTGQKTKPSEAPDNTEAIGLFINNKISLDSTDEEVANWVEYYNDMTDKRIFSCAGVAQEETNNKNNIFSILRNGNLFIGGSISYPDGASTGNIAINKIPDVIKVNKPKIVMKNDGRVYMAFDTFYNIDENGNLTEENLSQTIASAVNSIRLPRHTHEFDLWVEMEVIDIDTNSLYYRRIGAPGDNIALPDDEKEIVKQYVEDHNTYTIDELKKGIKTELNYLPHNDGINYEILTGTIVWERGIQKVPVKGEIKYSGSGTSPSEVGPYLIDPIVD